MSSKEELIAKRNKEWEMISEAFKDDFTEEEIANLRKTIKGVSINVKSFEGREVTLYNTKIALSEIIPMLNLEGVKISIKTSPYLGDRTYGEADAKNISEGKAYITISRKLNWGNDLVLDYNEGFHPTYTYKGVVAHEVGHVVFEYLKTKYPDATNLYITKNKNVRKVSEYSYKNPHEAFAEVFSMYVTKSKPIDEWYDAGKDFYNDTVAFMKSTNVIK
jgi:hypothetical protein